jgi:hypothetical protein
MARGAAGQGGAGSASGGRRDQRGGCPPAPAAAVRRLRRGRSETINARDGRTRAVMARLRRGPRRAARGWRAAWTTGRRASSAPRGPTARRADTRTAWRGTRRRQAECAVRPRRWGTGGRGRAPPRAPARAAPPRRGAAGRGRGPTAIARTAPGRGVAACEAAAGRPLM